MSDLWVPPSCRRTPVQMTGKERVCVLVHKDTGRILCFAQDDPFAAKFVDSGYIKHEINHAHEYDMWARRLREQSSVENQAADHAYLERENATRKRLRQQLRDKLNSVRSGPERKAVESALHCLEVMEKRKKRYRAETFMLNEGYDSTRSDIGEQLVNEIMVPKK
jgi:hypothetical protein